MELEVMTMHLIKLLKTAPNMYYLDLTTISIQNALRCSTVRSSNPSGGKKRQAKKVRSTSNSLFERLPEEIQAIVRPYLDSKYSMKSSTGQTEGIVFNSDMTVRKWLGLWLTQLIDNHLAGASNTVSFLS